MIKTNIVFALSFVFNLLSADLMREAYAAAPGCGFNAAGDYTCVSSGELRQPANPGPPNIPGYGGPQNNNMQIPSRPPYTPGDLSPGIVVPYIPVVPLFTFPIRVPIPGAPVIPIVNCLGTGVPPATPGQPIAIPPVQTPPTPTQVAQTPPPPPPQTPPLNVPPPTCQTLAQTRNCASLTPATTHSLCGLMAVEVGGMTESCQVQFIETVMNRAYARFGTADNASISRLMNNTAYWGAGQARRPYNAAACQRVLQQACAGSNMSNFATDNASGNFGIRRQSSRGNGQWCNPASRAGGARNELFYTDNPYRNAMNRLRQSVGNSCQAVSN